MSVLKHLKTNQQILNSLYIFDENNNPYTFTQHGIF